MYEPTTAHTPTGPAYPAPAADLVRYAAPLQGQVELSGERPDIVFVPHGGGYVGVPKDSLPAGYLHTQFMPAARPRDLTPVPLLDPRAQMVAATGVGAGAAGPASAGGWGRPRRSSAPCPAAPPWRSSSPDCCSPSSPAAAAGARTSTTRPTWS
ncbi:hypothetical protein VSR01_00250 [Actinacidiphila sp. DG2A-62]|uniref:hypothetical protein n=1 Tax=Actinacidiphila sp. DG2A-62 TaxID=3108821 RepID=UPI002DB6419D|nr:hypothetical protein [Actinacidiphila sp. DG2A-62]MEC3992060.1 hypothetical protein [Actinacidiphila sp. DG2A-62]